MGTANGYAALEDLSAKLQWAVFPSKIKVHHMSIKEKNAAERPILKEVPNWRAAVAGTEGAAVLGNLVDFRRDALRYYSEWSRQYGDIVALRLGTWPAVLLNHSDYVEHVLVKNARNFIKFPFFFRHVREIFGQGLLTSEGELWHRQRRLAAPAFHAQRLAVYGDTTVRFTERMLESWRPGDVRDVHIDTTALTMCIAAKALFNAEVKKDVAEIGQAFNAIVEEIAVRLRRPFRILDAVPTPGNIRYVRAVHRVDRLVTKIIRERREQGGDRGDLLSILLLGRDEENQSMSERQLRDEVITLLVAGHETTAIALSWTWYLLAHSPDVDAKLAAELRDVLGGRAPTVSDLAQLTFTQQVVTEALRIYPPAWGFGREALADCEIGGYAIPAGTTIIIIAPGCCTAIRGTSSTRRSFVPSVGAATSPGNSHGSLTSRSGVGLASASAVGLQ